MWSSHPLIEVVADLFVGLVLPPAAVAAGESRPVVSVGDIHDGVVAPLPELGTRTLPSSFDPKFLVQEGDVLLTSRGTQAKVGWVRAVTVGAVATSTLIVARPSSLLRPEVLFAALSSPRGQTELLRRAKKSTATLVLTARDARSVPVPVPPAAVQESIAGLVRAGEDYFATAMELAALRHQTARAVSWSAIYPASDKMQP